MVYYLEPAELERYAEAERIEAETTAEIAKLIKLAGGRKPLTDWSEATSPEESWRISRPVNARHSNEWNRRNSSATRICIANAARRNWP